MPGDVASTAPVDATGNNEYVVVRATSGTARAVADYTATSGTLSGRLVRVSSGVGIQTLEGLPTASGRGSTGAAAPDWDTGCNPESFQSKGDACAGSECPQWREHR